MVDPHLFIVGGTGCGDAAPPPAPPYESADDFPTYTCPICKKQFIQNVQLVRHLRVVHQVIVRLP